MRRYLITGGLGFLGAALVRSLVDDGEQVVVLDDSSRGSVDRLADIADRFELIRGDVRDAETVARALEGIDVVCHLAFVNGTRFFYQRPRDVLEIGVKGILNVLDGCKRHGVKELIVASSSEVYQTPPSVPTDERVPLSIPDVFNPRYSYAGGKIITELLAIHYAEQFERVVIFRPHNVYGPNMGWDHVLPEFVLRLEELKRTQSGDAPLPFEIQGNGEQSRAFVFLDDFISGVRLLLDKGEHLNVYNIGTRDEIKIREFAQRVAKTMGLTIRIVPSEPAKGGTLRRCPDIWKLESLGYATKTSLDEGLQVSVDWYLANLPEEKK
jgi:nucleoside-diphosphate-sugar epimerase